MIELVMLAIVCQHLAHLLLCKAHHLVEAVGQRIVRADVESACEVIEGYWTYTCDEYTLDGRVCSCLYGVEECAQVACAVSLALIFVKTCGIGEDMIGEVVILVDEEIDFLSCFVAHFIQ